MSVASESVQRPPNTPELTQSVKAARADTRDVTIDTQVQRNVHAEQTNVAAGDCSISTYFQHRVTAFPELRSSVPNWRTAVFLQRCCYTLCSSSFADDLVFAHNGQARATQKGRMLPVTHQAGSTGWGRSLLSTAQFTPAIHDKADATQTRQFCRVWRGGVN